MAHVLLQHVLTECDSLLSSTSIQLLNRDYYVALLKILQEYTKVLISDSKNIDFINSKLNPFRYKFPVSLSFLIRSLMAAVPQMKSFLVAVEAILSGVVKICSGKRNPSTRKCFYNECSLLFKGIAQLSQLLSLDYKVSVKPSTIYRLWESNVLEHMRSTSTSSIILWIDDNPIEEALIENEESATVLSRRMKTVVKKGLEEFHFLADEKFEGRIRIAINTQDPEFVLKVLNEGPFKDKILDIIINKERIPLTSPQDTLTSLRDDIVLSAGTTGFINFIKMATLLWVGPLVDGALESALRRNGVVVHVVSTAEEAHIFLSFSRFLLRCAYLRVVLVEEAVKMELHPLVQDIRSLVPAPILIRTTNIREFDYTIYEYPFVKVTTDDKELDSFGNMSALPWAKTSSLFWNPSKKADRNKMKGDFVLHSISTSNLTTAGKDQSIVIYVNGERKEKSKATRDPISPVWADLNWTLEISSSDCIKIEVITHELLGTSFEGQVEFNLGVQMPLPVEQAQFTKLLKAQDLNDSRKVRKVRGTITISFSFKSKQESEAGKHFGKPLSDSLAQSDKDKTLHVTEKVIYNFLRFHLEDEGLFRLPGNATRVKHLRAEIDAGVESDWDEELVHDVGSLYKMYFTALSSVDTLLPGAMYNQYKTVAKIGSDEEKKLKSKELIDSLPEANQRVLVTLLGFLKTITKFSNINKMTPKNLAVCFAPTIIIPTTTSSDPASLLYDSHQVTEFLSFLIDNVHEVFPSFDPVLSPLDPLLVLSICEEDDTYGYAENNSGKRSMVTEKRAQFARTRASSAPMITDPVHRQASSTPILKTSPSKSGLAAPSVGRPEKRKSMLKQPSLAVFNRRARPKSERSGVKPKIKAKKKGGASDGEEDTEAEVEGDFETEKSSLQSIPSDISIDVCSIEAEEAPIPSERKKKIRKRNTLKKPISVKDGKSSTEDLTEYNKDGKL